MSTNFAAQSFDCPFDELSYLIIDDSATMRAWLRTAVADAGGKQIDQSINYNDALYRIRTRGDYNVVLCDYFLSDTRDGQQLLEEVRRARLLPPTSVWLMITGESSYEQVVSAAELTPDDYLLKPITPALFNERLAKAWDRRQTLGDATSLFEQGQYGAAMQLALETLKKRPRYAQGFQRLIGDCLLHEEHFREAADFYRGLLAAQADLPWAKLGLAKAVFHLDRNDETRAILTELMASTPDYFQAHDLMAKVYEREGNLEATKEMLKTVLKKNPKALGRHREVVRVAVATGDEASAVEAYEMMHTHGKGSSFLAPGDFCAYAGLLAKSADKGAINKLEALSNNLRDYHRENPAFTFSDKSVRYSAAKRAGNSEAAKAAYKEMQEQRAKLQADGVELDREQTMTLLDAAVDAGDKETSLNVAAELYTDHVGNQGMVGRINELMARGGMQEKSEELVRRATERLKELNLGAVRLANEGRMLEAVDEFIRLADTNRNIAVMLNAATAIVKYFEEVRNSGRKMDAPLKKRFVSRLESYLNFVRSRDPDNERLERITDAWKAIVGE